MFNYRLARLTKKEEGKMWNEQNGREINSTITHRALEFLFKIP